jgi:hypothetical protein
MANLIALYGEWGKVPVIHVGRSCDIGPVP